MQLFLSSLVSWDCPLYVGFPVCQWLITILELDSRLWGGGIWRSALSRFLQSLPCHPATHTHFGCFEQVMVFSSLSHWDNLKSQERHEGR